LLSIRLTSKRPRRRSPSPQSVRRHAATARQTVTFDNGTEFARHRALHSLAIDTFFCDP
jgi:IS30 family transposase